MSAKRFLDAVGHIDDELVAEFVERDMEMKPSPILRRAKRLWWVPIPAVAAAMALVVLLHHLYRYICHTGNSIFEHLLSLLMDIVLSLLNSLVGWRIQ